MKNIEQVINHALREIDATNAQLREKIYQTVWYSHEKTLLVDQSLTLEEKQQRREQLTFLIQKIETPYQSPQPAINGVPLVGSPVDDMFKTANVNSDAEFTDFSSPSQYTPPHPRKRSWLRANAAMIILSIILFVVMWSFYNSLIGVHFPFMPGNTTSQTTKIQSEEYGALGEKEASHTDLENTWISIFDPTDMTTLSTRGQTHIELRDNDGEGRFVRIVTPSSQDAAVLEIGEGVMALLTGKIAIFEIFARSASADVAQLSVTCDFGDNINCGRRHFEILPVRENMLFHVDMTQASTTAGRIFIRNHSVGSKNGLDIFDIRVRLK